MELYGSEENIRPENSKPEEDATEELTVYECHFYAGRSLRNGSAQPMKMLLSADIGMMLAMNHPDFWHAVIAIIEDDIEAEKTDEL